MSPLSAPRIRRIISPAPGPKSSRLISGWSVVRSHAWVSLLISPVRSVTCLRGLTSGRRQRLGLTTHSYFGPFARRKQESKLTCHNCKIEMIKAGRGRNSVQRFKCQTCGKRFSEPQQKPFGADVRLPQETVCRILHCLVEGNSVRGTARLCDVEKRTVLNVLALAGENCERLLGERIRDVPIQDVQCDEIWSFVGKKEGHKRPSETDAQEIGDAYTFIAIESNSKLIFAWHLGKRTLPHTEAFITKIRSVTGDSRFQISTDGFRPYMCRPSI
jgi:transposase-like protein